jgi:putative solute:sodium symporter small subunit
MCYKVVYGYLCRQERAAGGWKRDSAEANRGKGCFFFHNYEKEEIMSAASDYWRENIRLVIGCIIVWFVVSYGFGILLLKPMNAISLGGYKLGFWFAQQGSLYIFVVLIFFYAAMMNRLDRKYKVYED